MVMIYRTHLSLRDFGTSPLTIRCARPSTMAVLPTPGSPSSSGLFLVRRDRTCITLQKKRLHFNFSIFVPSLSWQTFGFKHYMAWRKRQLPYRRISSSLPITGSSAPRCADSTRSIP